MEIRQLTYVVAVAEEGGFTAAAARERVAQPAVSAQIAGLERELGQRLFRRTPKGAEPTEAGAELVRHARAVFAELTAAREAMDELAGLVRGRVAVGMVRGAPLGGLAAALGRFRQAHPGVELTLREAESDDLLARLDDRTLDLALAGLAGAAPPGLTTRTLVEAELAALVPSGHRWAHRKTVSLTDLAAESFSTPLATLTAGTGARSAFDAACRSLDVPPRIAFEVGTVGAAADLAREGLGVAVVPGGASDAGVLRLHPVAITRPVVRSRLVLAWAKDTPRDGRPAARALVAAARRYAASRSPASAVGRDD